MFVHNFKYAWKTLFKNKMLIFWTFVFPIVLGTFFKMAFSNIENGEKMQIIPIAIVENEDFDNQKVFKTSFEELSNANREEQLFNIQYTTEEKAKELLLQGEVIGYLKLEGEKPMVTVSTNGADETIFKYVTEEIQQTSDLLQNLSEIEIKEEMMAGELKIDYEKIYRKVLTLVEENEVKLKDISSDKLSYTMIEFYTLIGMSCLYGGMLSMVSINQTLANMSNQGKRIAVSPIGKGKIILSSLLASYFAQLIGIVILLGYTILVLKVDYGDNFALMALLSVIGSLAGLALGTFVGTLFKTSENTKTGILIALTMLWCYLSGMMGITMKYLIDKNIPIINQLNPASMITDGFYSLYYYHTLDRYWTNVIGLLIFAFGLISISFFCLRRQKYDNI